ncbi:chorismate-binding protein [Flavisericum labens]|uniref:chorismate-binding protein n=1 Tax=Flavisericum labens TaxID=3377112 RepID=UPI00387AAAC8
MTSEYFFDHISAHFSKQLPFVVYRKPNRKGLKAFLQSDAVLFYSDDFTEKGFVFSPFDDFEKSVLIPFEKSEMISETYGSYVETETFQSINTPNKTEKQNHIKLVKKGVDAIKHNQFKKVVLSRTETIELSESNPLNIFKRLLSTYPSAFVYCWYHPKVGLWLGATPETLIKIEDSQFSIMALAGTQDYNGTLNVNWQEKEKQEQQYVTDFIVKNLQPSVERLQVSDVETVKAGNLLHLKTMVSARLKSNTSLKNIIESLHPTPAVCGLPKTVAKQFILKNENYNREFYTGFLGELNMDKKVEPRSGKRNIENRAYAMKKKSTQLYVNLRCMQIKDEKAIIYVGGGITENSNPDSEWRETQLKSLVIKNIL